MITETIKIFRRPEIVTVARESADVIIYGFAYRIWIENTELLLEKIEEKVGEIYLNEQRILMERGSVTLKFQEGDSLLFEEGRITLFADQIEIEMPEEFYQTTMLELEKEKLPFEGFPHYKRSPRMIRRAPEEEITIQLPPSAQKMDKKGLVQIIVPPVMMLGITIAVSILMKRGLFVLISIFSTIVSIVTSVIKFVKDKKEFREQEQKRREAYEVYLLKIRKRISRAAQEEQEAAFYQNPPVCRLEQMVKQYSSRIYERSASDGDFLSFCIGYADEPAEFSIKMSWDELKLEKDALEEEARSVYEQQRIFHNKPVCVNIRETHLGLVGERKVLHEQIKLIVAQLAFFHSYHDLEIVIINQEKDHDDFQWMNWYPHFRIHAINTFGCVNNERMRDHVIGSMYRILKDRKLKQEESRKENRFLPHYIFIIDEPSLIMDHAIMEYLDKEVEGLGFSILYTTQMRSSLPENIRTVLQYLDAEQGILVLNHGEMVNRKIRLQRAEGISFEMMARNLSVLVHEKGIVTQIPESVTFFEMYHVERPQELAVLDRWKKNQAYRSLAVPLGLRGPEDYLYLNLHEKAHGPHGLVAGTTGSGKSEIIQSYILSLAVNFHPHEVGFLLIDYKGGGMAGLFQKLPHLLGTITNLDGSESLRAMASIKSELSRRQRLFGRNHVNHINDYNKLFKAGQAEEPLPHLFLISDEFAELKKEQPEFMSELISTARIGRSLGVHLILATQKPSGVVDDQIWTNSRFKLALKVQNEADSREILKSPDAAFITQAGRAYLQVGNNEIYELFQSAYSGAPYRTEAREEEENRLVYIVNELGQGELVNRDLSTGGGTAGVEITQLDATIAHLAEVYQELKPIPVRKPWLPPLPLHLISPCVQKYVSNINREEQSQSLDLKIKIGIVDIPEEQSQEFYEIDLMKDGNVAFFAAPGFGKTMFLTTVLISLALKNSVEMLHFYVCDFGNSGLIPLYGIPHTADYITMDDTERLGKLVRILGEEISRRKKLFARKMVQNFEVYNQSAGEPLKAIVVLVDHYDVVKEAGQEIEDFFVRLGRDGAGLGIYMIVTASRQGGIKFSAMNNYKHKITGFMIERADVIGIMGRSNYFPPEIPGRVLVKYHNSMSLMQMYTLVPFENELEYNQKIGVLIGQIQKMYPTQQAPRIPVLPEHFTFPMMAQYGNPAKDEIAIGLQKEKVEIVGFRKTSAPFLIVGDSGKGKTNLLKIILEQLVGEARIYLFDSSSRELFYHRGDEGLSYVDTGEELEDFLDEFPEKLLQRKSAYHKALESNPRLSPKEFYESIELMVLIIDDTDELAERCSGTQKAMAGCLALAAETGCGIIATVQSMKSKGYDEVTKFFKTTTEGILLGNPGSSSVFPAVSARNLPVMGEGLLYHGGEFERVLLPGFEMTQEEGDE